MTSDFKKHFRTLIISGAAAFALIAVIFAHGQTAPNAQTLREQLRPRYDIVALQDGVALVPRQRQDDIRIVEVRNGVVAINGITVSAQESRQRLGQDADAILRITYLDSAAQHELARPDSATSGNESTNRVPPERTQAHSGDLVRFGGDVTVARDEIIEGKVVAIIGSANVDGEVRQDVTVIGGSLTLGPDALVHGNVAVIGGSLDRAPGARVEGKVDNVAFGRRFGARAERVPPFRRPFWFWRVGTFVGALFRVMMLLLCALIITALGGHWVESTASRAAAEPLRAGLTGLLAELLFIPLVVLTVVVLAVSIIGIPLLLLVPFGIVLAAILMLVGFTGIAQLIGRRASARFAIMRGPYASVILGVLLLVAISLVARLFEVGGGLFFGGVVGLPLAIIGYLVEYAAWTTGIGALILTWLGTPRHMAPAPVTPAPPSPPAAA